MSNATAPTTEADIRRDERELWAARLRENADTFADFAKDKRAAVLLIALALDMPLGGEA
jgi:hypothetical protein